MIMIMKTYIKAELQIVRMNNNDIVTTSNITTHPTQGNGTQLAPGRKSIWD